MKKTAVLLAEGYEETEALLTVDILRRANIQCDTISMSTDKTVVSSHGIPVVADKVFEDNLDEYDLVVCPGGLPGAVNLRNDERVLETIRKFNNDPNKWIAAICAGPIVLAAADAVKGKKATCFPKDEFMDQLKNAGCIFEEDLVAVDDHIITARGPAATFAFGYAIVDALGFDSADLKKAMIYDRLKSGAL